MTPATDLLREAFRRRAIGAVERMAREASPEALGAAMSAATDTGTLARATAAAAAGDAVRQLDPLAGAIARSAEARERLVALAGGLLSASEVARAAGITRAAVDKRRAARRLLALRVRGDWAYPAAQLGRDGEPLPGLSETLQAVPEAALGWSVLDFLLAPEAALSGSRPMDALRDGRAADVVRLAKAWGLDLPG